MTFDLGFGAVYQKRWVKALARIKRKFTIGVLRYVKATQNQDSFIPTIPTCRIIDGMSGMIEPVLLPRNEEFPKEHNLNEGN